VLPGPLVSTRRWTAPLSLTLSRTLPLISGPRYRPAPPVSRSGTASAVPRRSPLFVQQRPLGRGCCRSSCTTDCHAGPPLSFFSRLHADTPTLTPFFTPLGLRHRADFIQHDRSPPSILLSPFSSWPCLSSSSSPTSPPPTRSPHWLPPPETPSPRRILSERHRRLPLFSERPL
jgi:hypothetical protein